MRTPIRFQSRLLVRRSYKPGRGNYRALGVTFRSVRRIEVKIVSHKSADANAPVSDNVITRSA